MAARADVALPPVALDDRYRLESGRVYLSGVQALVRLLIEQRRLDARAGLDTAGFVSGYRGSPLGGLDQALWQAAPLLQQHRIHFEPGLNEELAATMVQGSQQVGAIGGARVGGVFGLWYAKNPGVDRSGDALKHANAAGTAALGGVLAVSGDDPGATSSSIPNQCEHAFAAALMPTLAPADVGQLIEFGLAGWAMSRCAGVWVGLKTVADVVEASTSVALSPLRPPFLRPPGLDDRAGPPGLRWPESRWQQDERLQQFRLPAARAFAKANLLDRRVFGGARPRLGIVAAGKALGDVRQALAELGIDAAAAELLGLALFQVGMPWPLEPSAIGDFADGLDEVLVVEERRGVVEPQLKELAYHWPARRRPRIVGKTDELGSPLLPEAGVLDPLRVADVIAQRLLRLPGVPPELRARWQALPCRADTAAPAGADLVRTPHFCAGCPHARATRVPEGGLAMAGIGCHSLKLWMPDARTLFMVQMGGEGTNWLGARPFVQREHVFQNLGDGTYGHSGSLAVRAAVAAGARMTFRILYNGAVAMTGGQPAEGALSVAQIAGQMLAEGVRRVAVVAEEPARHEGLLPAAATLHPKTDLARVQDELAALPGVTVLIHDQLCAIEKRRRRRRGELPPVTSRPFIHEGVCEGCGDCVEQSQCSALLPVDTPLGRKRRIDASACNAELSCLEGLCPSFVSVDGAVPRRADLPPLPDGELPDPPPGDGAAEIIVHGIGGSGVVTVGAILGMAAHLEGRGVSVLDNTGIARKGGAVSTHVRLGAGAQAPHGSRIADARATLVVAADLVAAAESAALAKIAAGRTRVLLNADAVPTLNQRLDPAAVFDAEPLRRRLQAAAGADAVRTLDATSLAERLLGDAIFTNLLLLGAAFQSGGVPLGRAAIERSIELNGQGVEANRRAFTLGRLAWQHPEAVAQALAAARGTPAQAAAPATLDELVADRSAHLVDYQGPALAARYRALVELVRDAERRAGVEGDALARAVASGFHRLLAVKDEYEVARLYADPVFKAELERRFEPGWRLRYHLAPPWLARRDPVDGRPRKRAFGPWLDAWWPRLAALRGLRGTWFDPFGHTDERRLERHLADEHERTLREWLPRLDAARHPLLLAYAQLPERVRGFGAVKLRNLEAAQAEAARILARLQATLPD